MVVRSLRNRRQPVRMPSFAKMTIDALISVRDEADRLIRTRAASERKALEKQLSRLGGYVGLDGSGGGKRRGSSLKGKVAPKYRNPANKSETWAGRGVRPRWLQAALKKGRKIEEFAIVRGRPKAKPSGRKKAAGRKRSPGKAPAAEAVSQG
jgi:DNA-binding protein H-NS